jgi:hypothetical protein
MLDRLVSLLAALVGSHAVPRAKHLEFRIVGDPWLFYGAV